MGKPARFSKPDLSPGEPMGLWCLEQSVVRAAEKGIRFEGSAEARECIGP